jgi:hypothetical protein
MTGQELIIKTSEQGWLSKIAKAYKARIALVIVDDAKVGIDPTKDTIFAMGKKADLNSRDWTAVLIALGIAGMGVHLLLVAIADPEPFSKMAFTIGAGAALTLGGGFGAIRVLTGHKPPTVRVTTRGFEVSWE